MHHDDNLPHCIWKRQPETAEEIEQAIDVFAVAEMGCHRYAGDGREIIKRIGWDYCDAPQPSIASKIWAVLRSFLPRIRSVTRG